MPSIRSVVLVARYHERYAISTRMGTGHEASAHNFIEAGLDA
jgi:hypothetical protein